MSTLSVPDWIALGSSLGALSAALIGLFTLRELHKQRRASYKPDLCLLNSYFYLKTEKFGGLRLATYWSPTRDQAQKVFSSPVLQLANVGFGAAKKVKAMWSYDMDRLIQEINELAQKAHQTFYLEKDGYFVSVISSGESIYSVNSKMNEFDFEYVLPLGQNPKSRKLDIPPAYAFLVSVYLSLNSMNENYMSDMPVTTLNLSMSYLDIGGGSHKTNHKYECKLLSATSCKPENEVAPEFEIQITESA